MATYYVDLPSDYLHMLNCICIYKVNKTYKCYNDGDTWRAAATRLTADAYSQVLDNFWMKPSYKRPYYYIHNINQNLTNPTNPYKSDSKEGTDLPSDSFNINSVTLKNILQANDNGSPNANDITEEGYYLITYNNSKSIVHAVSNGDGGWDINGLNDEELDSIFQYNNTYYKCYENGLAKEYQYNSVNDSLNKSIDLFKTIEFNGNDISNVERKGQVRYGNTSKVRCEIRYGTDRSLFELIGVYIDYIKTPQQIRLTQEELDWTEDKSQMLEFPDYVCQEIVNELVHIIMENLSDQRLTTHPVVSQSIANPAQAQAPQAQGQSAQ